MRDDIQRATDDGWAAGFRWGGLIFGMIGVLAGAYTKEYVMLRPQPKPNVAYVGVEAAVAVDMIVAYAAAQPISHDPEEAQQLRCDLALRQAGVKPGKASVAKIHAICGPIFRGEEDHQ